MDEPARAVGLARAVGFLHDFARRKAPRVVPAPGGFAVLDDRFPGSYDDNKLMVRTAADDTELRGRTAGDDAAGRLLAAADEVPAERAHRLVCVHEDRRGTALAPAFAAAGYAHETNLVMAFRGDAPQDPPRAERLGLDELVPVLRRDWRRTLPQAPADVIDELARRAEARLRGAGTVGFHAIRTAEGEIAARADLYVHSGVAQIENLFTTERHRSRGYARALMAAMLAAAAGAELIFLVADSAGWPRRFYARLGFEEKGRTHDFLRT
ncbi:GNAT family N-acetyltransferase [Nonomuraea terrae]|uniref:GNAT family N-acetyltransferase n=1 Tax=Nonomuraea terrae TaxID=2530383 RepID=UPI0037A17600